MDKFNRLRPGDDCIDWKTSTGFFYFLIKKKIIFRSIFLKTCRGFLCSDFCKNLFLNLYRFLKTCIGFFIFRFSFFQVFWNLRFQKTCRGWLKKNQFFFKTCRFFYLPIYWLFLKPLQFFFIFYFFKTSTGFFYFLFFKPLQVSKPV